MIVVVCPSCQARFRLAETLFQGAKGLRLRCRKCGDGIAVLNPATASAEPEPAASPSAEPIPAASPPAEVERPESLSTEPEPGAAAPKEYLQPAQADLVGIPFGTPADPREEYAQIPGDSFDDLTFPPQVESSPPTPGQAGSAAQEASVPLPPEEPAPLPPWEEPIRKILLPELPRPGNIPPGAPRGKFAAAAVSVLALLIAGGVGYFALTDAGRETFGQLVKDVQSKWRGQDPAPAYDIRNLTGYYEMNETAGKLFIIKGTVTNTGSAASGGIRIQAFLFNDKSQALGENSVFAGNDIPDDSLRRQERGRIEAAMRNRLGEGNSNKDIPPGKSLPFTVVFFPSQDNISSYRVVALDAR
jgi:predicted Zn finger-like uncharacterized protein